MGPTSATEDQYLYFSLMSPMADNIDGIYLNTVGTMSGGTKLVNIFTSDGQAVWDIEWLPDASGFLFTAKYFDNSSFRFTTDIFQYTFSPPGLTQLTNLGDERAHALSISPDGQYVVFEREADESHPTCSLWIMDLDGSGLHELIDDACRPAWGPTYVSQAANAEFVAAQTSGVRPLAVQFTNQSTGDYDTCTWTFGDGGTSTSCGNPTHTDTTKGIYTVALTVTGEAGADTRTRTGYITVQDPLQASFSGSPSVGVPPLLVTFTNQSTGDYDTCAWTFGDGGTSTSCGNPTHTYAAKGVYTVVLTVSGPGGTDTETRDQYISVQNQYRVYLPLTVRGH